uniref:Uncharacterized protein n=1 Tax=Triticum urartu TaxID=4572 RepID=A0A8R7UUC6_TRIUA
GNKQGRRKLEASSAPERIPPILSSSPHVFLRSTPFLLPAPVRPPNPSRLFPPNGGARLRSARSGSLSRLRRARRRPVAAMDSEDDTRDSADEDFYSGGEAGLALSDDGDADYDFADRDSDDSDDLISHRQQVIIDWRPVGPSIEIACSR